MGVGEEGEWAGRQRLRWERHTTTSLSMPRAGRNGQHDNDNDNNNVDDDKLTPHTPRGAGTQSMGGHGATRVMHEAKP